MKGRTVALDRIGDRAAAALFVDGRLEDILIDTEDGIGPGAIFRAVCDRPLKGQGGMMLRLPEGTAFLRQGKGLRPGQGLLVQVTGFAEDGKAVPVTPTLVFKGRYAIATPGAPGINVSRQIRDEEVRDRLLEIAHDAGADAETGLILRSAAAEADEDDLAEDVATQLALANDIAGESLDGAPELLLDAPDAHLTAWREWSSPPPDEVDDAPGAFDRHGVREALEALSGPQKLPGGGHMWVEPTRALTAVDVNTGGDFSTAAGLKANIAAARELPRQMRLRGLGGQVVMDLAPLAKKDRRVFEQSLRAALRSDAVDTALVGWTPLGHFELQRKRERRPVALKDLREELP